MMSVGAVRIRVRVGWRKPVVPVGNFLRGLKLPLLLLGEVGLSLP